MNSNNFEKHNFKSLSEDFIYSLLLKEVQKIGYTDEFFLNDFSAILFYIPSKQIVEKFNQYDSNSIFNKSINVIYYDKQFFNNICTSRHYNEDGKYTINDIHTNKPTKLYTCKRCGGFVNPCLILKIDNESFQEHISAFNLNLK